MRHSSAGLQLYLTVRTLSLAWEVVSDQIRSDQVIVTLYLTLICSFILHPHLIHILYSSPVATMSTMLYTLAGVSLLAAMIVTILNGLVYAALQSASHAPAAGLAPVALGVLTCTALIGLNVILYKDLRGDQQWPRWKQGIFYFTGVYLFIAAASTTGTIAKDELQSTANNQSLFIARSVFWALSIFSQGLYYGYLLVSFSQKSKSQSPSQTGSWPRPYSQELKTLPDSPSTLTPPSRVCDPEEPKFDTRRSSLRKYPRRSHRFSGGTLYQNSLTQSTTNTDTTTKGTRPNSFETTSSISTITPTQTHTTTTTTSTETDLDRDTRPLLRTNIRSMPSLRQEHIHASLDSLVRPASHLHPDSPLPSPSSSSFSSSPSSSTESNIHPLFRANSPSPSPKPSPGSSVTASPSAGQTITKQTLTRMRSERSLRGERERDRVPSPLPSPRPSLASAEEERVMAFMWGRYELNESPYEK